jgi:hypothetical protein
MVVANVGDSQVVLASHPTTEPSHHPSHRPSEVQPTIKSLLTGRKFLCVRTTVVADVVRVSSNMMYVEE